MWSSWEFHALLQAWKITRSFGKKVRQLLVKLNTLLPEDPIIPFVDVYPGGIKTYVHKKRVQECSQQFIHNSKKRKRKSGTAWVSINRKLEKTNGHIHIED